MGARPSRAVHEGFAGMLAHPAATVKRAARRSVKFVTVVPNGPGFFQRRLFGRKGIIPASWLPWYLRVKAVQYWIIVFAGVTGLILAERSLVKWWALLFVPYLFFVHSLTLPKDRFAWPWIIVLLLFGSACCSLLKERMGHFKPR